MIHFPFSRPVVWGPPCHFILPAPPPLKLRCRVDFRVRAASCTCRASGASTALRRGRVLRRAVVLRPFPLRRGKGFTMSGSRWHISLSVDYACLPLSWGCSQPLYLWNKALWRCLSGGPWDPCKKTEPGLDRPPKEKRTRAPTSTRAPFVGKFHWTVIYDLWNFIICDFKGWRRGLDELKI